MSIEIREVKYDQLGDYEQIQMIVEITSLYQLVLLDNGLKGITFNEVPVSHRINDPSTGEGPKEWAQMFNLENWGFFIAYDKNLPVGAIALAYKTEGCKMLAYRDDLVVVWDIRILPEYKKLGIGSRLFSLTEDWAKSRGCKLLKVETQNNNVNACKFYAKQGFTLGEISKYAY